MPYYLDDVSYTRNAHEVVGLPSLEDEEQGNMREEALPDHHLGFKYTLKIILASPHIWCLAFALFFLNVVRYDSYRSNSTLTIEYEIHSGK